MTRKLTITAAEWASVTDGTLWLVREGEPECSLGWECDDSTHDGECGEPRPPVEFVQACAPCMTCGGSRDYDGGEQREPIPCPDCRIELVGPCPRLGSTHPVRHVTWEAHCGSVGTWASCDRCLSGTVTLGYGYAIGQPMLLGDWPGMGLSPGSLAALAHYGNPSTLVGQWVLRVQVVKR